MRPEYGNRHRAYDLELMTQTEPIANTAVSIALALSVKGTN